MKPMVEVYFHVLIFVVDQPDIPRGNLQIKFWCFSPLLVCESMFAAKTKKASSLKVLFSMVLVFSQFAVGFVRFTTRHRKLSSQRNLTVPPSQKFKAFVMRIDRAFYQNQSESCTQQIYYVLFPHHFIKVVHKSGATFECMIIY